MDPSLLHLAIISILKKHLKVALKHLYLTSSRAGRYGPKNYHDFFLYQLISLIIPLNVKSLFLSNLKPEFCSKETRPLIFLNKITI